MQQTFICTALLLLSILGCQQQINSPERWLEYQQGVSHYLQGRPGDYRKAASYFKSYLRSAPQGERYAQALFRIALCHLKLGEKVTAQQYLEQCISCAPPSDIASLALENLGDIYFEKADYPQAQKYYQDAIAVEVHLPRDRLLSQLAITLQRQAKWEQARKVYQRLLQLFPRSTYAATANEHMRYCFFSLQIGAFHDRQRALKLLQQARAHKFQGEIVVVHRSHQRYFCVRIGRFPQRQQALAQSSRLKQQLGLSISPLVLP